MSDADRSLRRARNDSEQEEEPPLEPLPDRLEAQEAPQPPPPRERLDETLSLSLSQSQSLPSSKRARFLSPAPSLSFSLGEESLSAAPDSFLRQIVSLARMQPAPFTPLAPAPSSSPRAAPAVAVSRSLSPAGPGMVSTSTSLMTPPPPPPAPLLAPFASLLSSSPAPPSALGAASVGAVLADFAVTSSSASLSLSPPRARHSILNVDNKPSPMDVGEFLRNPRQFHPSVHFINTFVEEETVLTQAIKTQNVPAVEVLLHCGADPNAVNRKGVPPLSVAAHRGNTALLSLLVLFGAAVNAHNASGSTALLQAAHFGHVPAVTLLLSHGAVADYANAKGTTALMRASQEGHAEIARILIEARVDVNRRNNEGMNALMLASQRGHANIALSLIKSRAAMDEQTAQGSTALMLAAKRGHERCVDVLVSTGAEIFLRDRRLRTAVDTAMKRNHVHLLPLLDTQVQVARVQEMKRRQRESVIRELREAFLSRRLRVARGEWEVHRWVEAARQREREKELKGKDPLDNVPLEQGPLVVLNPRETQRAIDESLCRERYEEMARGVPSIPGFAAPAKRVSNYADWHWVSLFYRCMSLPEGVFELVMEMLPMPRVWHWSLDRLARRCRLAPLQAMRDMSVIMDEILADACIVAGPAQTNLLMKLSRSPHMYQLLLQYHDFTPALLDTVQQWGDVQSLMQRSNETDLVFKAPFARRMLTAAISLYRWHRQRNSSHKTLGLVDRDEELLASQRKKVRFAVLHSDEMEMLAATDAGGEEASDIEEEIAMAEQQQNALDIAPGVEQGVDSDDESVGGGGGGGVGHPAEVQVLAFPTPLPPNAPPLMFVGPH